MKRKLLLLSTVCMMVFFSHQTHVFSQGVTTSALEGTVLNMMTEPLEGANIVAIHEPSGTRYGTTSRSNGRFNIPNVRVGGPYKVTVSYVGYETDVISNLQLSLGQTTDLLFILMEEGTTLDEVVVVARAGSAGRNSGSSTRIDRETIENMPTINRSFNDFLRLTPQSGAVGGGISFAGMNNRFNAIYIDGAVNNDVFGLANSGTNGGQIGISPFSPDIIDQFQVVISPYDVTLGGFAGGGVNAVTKSGTNTFEGTAYTFFRNETLVGRTNGVLADRLGLEDSEREQVDEFTENLYGFSFGGPIIQDKMFLFTNVEIQRDETPKPFNVLEYTSEENRASESDLNNLRQHLINNFGYDPGTFGNTSDNLNGTKIFAKIDYNISSEHRLTLRHQYTNGERYERFSGNNRTINYTNNGRFFPSTTNSSGLELNSRFGTDYSNNLILGYTRVRDNRQPLGDNFPYVYITDNGGMIRLGSEEFSTANALDQDIITLTNNFNIYRGDHKITLGTHNEFYSIYNVFIPQNFGTYEFESLEDFMNNEPAAGFDRAYSLVDDIDGVGTAAAADFNAIQLGIYGQNEWSVNRNLTLTAGLRLDLPIITDDPIDDNHFNNNTLPIVLEHYEEAEGARAGKAPDGQLMFSPRVGFTYDVNADGFYVVRGGAGVFTSRIPFVWPGAMFNNNGLTQGRVSIDDLEGDVFFNPDWDNQPKHPDFKIPAGDLNLFAEDFKYPQVFRTNLAFDIELPFGIESTLEGLYTKTINNLYYININSDPEVAFTWTGTPDNRQIFTRSRLDDTYSEIYLAKNTNEGYTYNIALSLAKTFDFGLRAFAAYSYGDSYSLSEGTSSQNSSQWRGQVNINGRNNPEFGRSDFAVGHRVISSLSYSYNWTQDGANRTTLSLFMNGQTGTPYSYIIAGSNARNLNNESGSTGRNRSLAFIPADATQINLIDYNIGSDENPIIVTAEEQWNKLNSLISSDEYLESRRGQYAEKNGDFGPFTAIFDVALRHDFGLTFGGQVHKFQVSLDVANFGNMLNKNWGTQYLIPGPRSNEFNYYSLYQFEGYEENETTPQFTFREGETGLDRFNIAGLSSRWTMLFGLRYMFN